MQTKIKIQIEISKLEQIIDAAKRAKLSDSSYSDTLEIEVTKPCDTHTGSDTVGVILKSNYQECVGESIFWR